MSNTPTPDQLRTINSNELLPRLSPWAILGGGSLITIFGIAVLLATVLKYNVAVKVSATIRPTGDLRLVQAAIEGTVKQISVTENQVVKAGQPIAQIDDSRLMTTKNQLQGDLRQGLLQLTQVNAQISALDTQILAETNLTQRSRQAAEAELSSQQRLYQDRQITAQSDFQEASAALTLAQEELDRFRQLAASGAIPTLRLKEKEAAVTVATAKLNRAKAVLNPTNADLAKAREQIAQVQARGEATLATLQQQRQQLIRNQIELQRQRDRTQKELQQLDRDFQQTIIRAPLAGTLLQLNLRNPKQVVRPGEAVAYIAPLNAPLLIKAQVSAQDIDQVKPGQAMQMQVSACPYPDYGTLKGTVKTVAPDALPATGNTATAQTATAYEVIMQPDTTFVGQGDRRCPLQPGMEGKADIISRQETVMQFILRKARLLANL